MPLSQTRRLHISRFFSQPLILSCVLGTISAFSLAPWHIWPCLFLGLSGLYYILGREFFSKKHNDNTNIFKALLYGWGFGLGYFVFGLYWIGNALLVEGNSYVWAYPLALIALPAFLSLFLSLPCFIAVRFFKLSSFSGYLGFCGLIFLFEWLRGHLFTGFPWNLFGHSLSGFLPFLQITHWGSIYILSFLVILWSSFLGFAYFVIQKHGVAKKTELFISFLTLIFLAVSCFIYGDMRLKSHVPQFHKDLTLRVVQPNIAQEDKWARTKMVDNFYHHLDLSLAQSTEENTTYIIWPETSLSQWFLNDKSSMIALSETLQSYPGQAYLLTGSMGYDPKEDRYSNALYLMDNQGKTLHKYHKSHLVPFGEYIPFQDLLPITPLTGFKGLLRGNGPQSFTTPQGISYAPLICYEIIFPGQVINPKNVPDFILNISNDAWYGKSAGPHQHMAHAQIRAVEEGIPVVRVANTGISAVIDPVGRILYKADLFQAESTLHPLPQKLIDQQSSSDLQDIESLARYLRQYLAPILAFCLILIGFFMESIQRGMQKRQRP